jgi:Mesyanzhinovviridae DNA primase
VGVTAVNFLKRFHPTTPWALVSFGPGTNEVGPARTFDPKVDEDVARQFIGKLNGQHNIYFVVNRVTGKPTQKVSKRDIEEVHWLHADVDLNKELDWSDPHAVEAERQRVLDRLRRFVRPPTAIAWSGGGFQGFWRLSEVMAVNGDKELIRSIERRMQRIEKSLGADACHNIDRIMRLPGTLNVLGPTKLKAGRKPALAELVEFHDDRIYDLEDFPELESPRTTRGAHYGPDAESLERIRAALRYIPADIYDVYLRVGMLSRRSWGIGDLLCSGIGQ